MKNINICLTCCLLINISKKKPKPIMYYNFERSIVNIIKKGILTLNKVDLMLLKVNISYLKKQNCFTKKNSICK